MTKKYDAIIIGSGQAAYALGYRIAEVEGWKTAYIEEKHLGGSCVNEGCTPTKTLVASARVAYMARRAAEYGVNAGDVSVDLKAVMARKDEMVMGSRGGLEGWFATFKNLDLIYGRGEFVGPNTVQVNGELLEAENIFINTGTRPNIPPIEGLDEVEYMTNRDILNLEEVPEHLIVVGGSYIGLEMGQIFRRFGSEVTIVEMSSQLIGREDEDVSEGVREILEAEGISVRTDSKCISVDNRDGKIVMGMDCTDPSKEVVGTHLLLATGRKPNSNIGLDKAGVEVNQRGTIVVNDRLETNVPGIWALGDVNGRGAFTHTSYNDYEILENILFGDDTRRVSDRIITYGLFIDPPLGRVGMTEKQALAAGHNLLVGKKPMAHISRAKERGETFGFMKFLVDADTERLLGAAILGIGGDEVISSITNMMYADAPYTVITNAVHIHPTVAELIPTTLGSLKRLE
jgi:pyruvate/2-oxoglutarate dehydrogenase complex dihydrolipoamide dehydrogenase (E3) component